MINVDFGFKLTGRHSGSADYLTDTKERLAWFRRNNPTQPRCYGGRCAQHHPVTVGEVQVQELFTV